MISFSSRIKHLCHTIIFTAYLIFTMAVRYHTTTHGAFGDSGYYFSWTSLVSMLRYSCLLHLPFCILNHTSLLLYNLYETVSLKHSNTSSRPFICFRIATKGDYPLLVKNNVDYNIDICRKAGLKNFLVEVVTSKQLRLKKNPRIRELVIPTKYRTENGTLFKARALQYCLESEINILCDDDWIVHLDEDTLLSENAVRGILNFCMDGKHKFGQGIVLYNAPPIFNWITTLADSVIVGDHIGRLRLQFKCFKRPLFGCKGSFLVAQCAAERKVTFDFGPDGSVGEDTFFALMAWSRFPNYSFGFIEGEMSESSCLTLIDFLHQRKRWFQGLALAALSPLIPWSHRIFIFYTYCAWMALPLNFLNHITMLILEPTPSFAYIDLVISYMDCVYIYIYLFGTAKSFGRNGLFCVVICLLGTLIVCPFNTFVVCLAVLWGSVSNKHQFRITPKK